MRAVCDYLFFGINIPHSFVRPDSQQVYERKGVQEKNYRKQKIQQKTKQKREKIRCYVSKKENEFLLLTNTSRLDKEKKPRKRNYNY